MSSSVDVANRLRTLLDYYTAGFYRLNYIIMEILADFDDVIVINCVIVFAHG